MTTAVAVSEPRRCDCCRHEIHGAAYLWSGALLCKVCNWLRVTTRAVAC